MSVVNLRILAHPLNWATCAVWLFAVGLAITALHILPNEKKQGTAMLSANNTDQGFK